MDGWNSSSVTISITATFRTLIRGFITRHIRTTLSMGAGLEKSPPDSACLDLPPTSLFEE